MTDKLTGQVAVVTGAGHGIGSAIAERLAGEGAKVALAARTGEELAQTAAEWTDYRTLRIVREK